MSDKDRTHCVAVAGYIFRNDRLLLLKRKFPPYTLVPAGGHLQADEDPITGILREVKEETGLDVEIIGVAHTWLGKITTLHEPLLCINFLARTVDLNEPRLSGEHEDFKWVSREEIVNGVVATTDNKGNGYQVDSLLDAFDKYERLV